MTNLLPAHTTPAKLAAHLGVSERTVRDTARAIGACRVIGKKTLMTDADVALFMEAIKPCPSRSTGAGKSGTTAAPSPVGGYEDLVKQRTKPARNALRRKLKPTLGSVISMDQART